MYSGVIIGKVYLYPTYANKTLAQEISSENLWVDLTWGKSAPT